MVEKEASARIKIKKLLEDRLVVLQTGFSPT